MARTSKDKSEWRNRIVGQGVVNPAELIANPMNWRNHPKKQIQALTGLLKEVGWVQNVIVNKTTGHIVDGHARVGMAVERKEDSIPVVYVELTEDEERLVLASLDPIGTLAESSKGALEALLATVSTGETALQELVSNVAENAGLLDELNDNPYTQKVEVPVYEARGEQPVVSSLTDSTKVDALLHEINRADIPTDVKDFLTHAAQRHRVFRYDAIAEYYAHASADVQRLMERSALVIIDFNQAIEAGFVSLNERLEDAFNKDYPDAG